MSPTTVRESYRLVDYKPWEGSYAFVISNALFFDQGSHTEMAPPLLQQLIEGHAFRRYTKVVVMLPTVSIDTILHHTQLAMLAECASNMRAAMKITWHPPMRTEGLTYAGTCSLDITNSTGVDRNLGIDVYSKETFDTLLAVGDKPWEYAFEQALKLKLGGFSEHYHDALDAGAQLGLYMGYDRLVVADAWGKTCYEVTRD
jgi:hypothetical protein